MGILAVRRWADLDAAEQARLLARSTAAVFEPGLQASIEAIFEDVRERGDAAVLDATERFDGVRLAPGNPRVRPDELEAAHAATDPALLAGIREAIHNSRLFNAAQVRATALGWLA
jgi:histidinol dehydrogenase